MVKKMLFLGFGVCLGVLVLFTGCAGTKSLTNVRTMAVIERIPEGDRPVWADKGNNYWIESGNHYFMGYEDDSLDLQACITEAERTAEKRLTEQVKAHLTNDIQKLIETQKYEPQTIELLNKTFSQVLSKTSIPYLSESESYSEKVKEVLNKEKRTYYRSFVLVELKKAGYEKMFKEVMSEMKKQFKASKTNKKILDNLESKYLNSLVK